MDRDKLAQSVCSFLQKLEHDRLKNEQATVKLFFFKEGEESERRRRRRSESEIGVTEEKMGV